MNKATGYYFTPESVAEYIEMSEGSDGREIIQKLRKYLPEGSSVLELGTGPGRDLGILMNTYLATGSDISPIFMDHCRKILPEAELLQLDAVNIDEDRTFDAIYPKFTT